MSRILLIDDDPFPRRLYQELLTNQGYEIDTAKNGLEALKLLEKKEYAMAVSDLRMPEMDGHQLVSTIRATPKLRMLPVLMLTGSDDKKDLLESLHAGVSDFCQKTPDDYAELLARLRNLLRMKELQDEVERASRTDALTALANRRHGVERLGEEISRSARYERELTLALMDIDHFKTINDTHGHQAGDEVLVAVSSELQRYSRDSDTVIRWGGEEFLFVFPETSLGEGAGIVERFRQFLADTPVFISVDGGTNLPVTISGGVSQLESDDTLETLVDRADTALYKAKEEGRNRLLVSRSGALEPVPSK